MKNFKYDISDLVIEKGSKNVGVVTDQLDSMYDYFVTYPDGSHSKFREDEIECYIDTTIFLKLYETVNLVSTGEEARIIHIDYNHKKAELEFKDKSLKVYSFDEIEKTNKSGGMKLTNNNTQLHKQIIDEMHDTYLRKNADYGNSFEEQFSEYGMLSVLIRLDDKMRRLKQLHKSEAQVKDESKRDTLMDLANYAIMSVMELDKKGGK
jgi:Nucleotide modification associated domain 1